MKIKLVAVAFLFLAIFEKCLAKNILVLMDSGTESSDKWNKVLMKGLANRGHALTIVTAHTPWNDQADDSEWPNSRFIYLKHTERLLQQRYANLTSQEIMSQSVGKYLIHWYDRQMTTCRLNVESVGMSEVINLAMREKLKYDVILYDMAHGAGCLLRLAHLWRNVPIVGLASGHLNNDILSLSRDAVLKPALDPHKFSDFPVHMNFWLRLQNSALYAFDWSYGKWIAKPVIEGLWSKNMHSRNIIAPKSLESVLPRIKVILANYHPLLHSLQTLPINVIPVPGLHIQETQPKSALQKMSLEFIENTRHEVILIYMEMINLDPQIIQQMLEVIHSLPLKSFIWLKGDSKLMGKNVPTNLILAEEEHVQKMLAHEKIKCSILNPDLLRIQESLYHGVPFIAISSRPAERYINQRIAERQLGIPMDLSTFTIFALQNNLKLCLSRNFAKKAIQRQNSLRNQQQTGPLQTALWWVEHIAENPDDDFLTKHDDSLSYIAKNSLDVIGIIELFVVLCIANIILVGRQTLKSFKNMSKSKKNKTNSDIVKKSKKLKAKTSKKQI